MTEFAVEVHLRCRCPKSVKSAARRAANFTLHALPRKVLSRALKNRQPPYELEFSIITAAAMQKLNRHYRHKDRPTDVLAFSQLEVEGMVLTPQVGEVLICWKVAKQQAKESGISALREVQELAVHGVLHVFGYDHERGHEEARRMFSLQRKIMLKMKS